MDKIFPTFYAKVIGLQTYDLMFGGTNGILAMILHKDNIQNLRKEKRDLKFWDGMLDIFIGTFFKG